MNTKIKLILVVLIFWGVVNQCSANEDSEEQDDEGEEESKDSESKGGAKDEKGDAEEDPRKGDPEEPDWCDLKCEDGTDNVACIEKITDTFDLSCYNYSIDTTPEKRSEILHWHNTYRNYAVSGPNGLPKATNMRQLDWNEDLELSANIWLLLCVINLAPCRRTPQFEVVGQNFNIVGTKRRGAVDAPGLMSCLLPWADEEYRASNETIAEYSIKGDNRWTANFANLVAAETTSIGCGVATYQQSGYHFRSVVCNYGPGLKEGLPVYQEGLPCQGCPSNWTCRNESLYPDLCSQGSQPLGISPPIENNAEARTNDVLDLSLLGEAPPMFRAWILVLEILGSTCVYFWSNSGITSAMTNVF